MVISLGKKLLPASTQPYLSTSPRKKACLLVPFSQITHARDHRSSRLIAKHPPSPELMFLVSWKEKVAKSPKLPRCLDSPSTAIHAPMDWAASSMSMMP